jgi:pyrroline-5-carboxylate reductase
MLGFIGMGNMGRAIKAGLHFPVEVYDPCYDNNTVSSEVEIARKCKYILLCVKPQNIDEILTKIAPELNQNHVIISICAGISIDYIQHKLSIVNRQLSIAQVMPNTPMMLGQGASAVAFSDNTSQEERGFVVSVLESCGISEEIPAAKMNEVICVNGSSPAFIYKFAKCFIDYATEQGIDEKSALSLFSQTLIGAGHMLIKSEMTPDELIAQVKSPGGTTEAGLDELEKQGFSKAVKAACESCTKRAYALLKN